ncbi:hypothetical protein BJV74DRAFT_795711 [Russula compacta]|nr:hypothetical protein BJV74DRAFT_795711 [Russula compacta]
MGPPPQTERGFHTGLKIWRLPLLDDLLCRGVGGGHFRTPHTYLLFFRICYSPYALPYRGFVWMGNMTEEHVRCEEGDSICYHMSIVRDNSVRSAEKDWTDTVSQVPSARAATSDETISPRTPHWHDPVPSPRMIGTIYSGGLVKSGWNEIVVELVTALLDL